MSGCIYDRVFLAPIAKEARGWKRGGGNRFNPEQASRGPKISIAWWLVPSVIVYLAASALFLG